MSPYLRICTSNSDVSSSDRIFAAPSVYCFLFPCAGGERDLAKEDLCGNSVGLHQTRLGSSK
ncbi:hypothetical protein XENOCAPTIV_002106, partial [Xenoophorus captivus]